MRQLSNIPLMENGTDRYVEIAFWSITVNNGGHWRSFLDDTMQRLCSKLTPPTNLYYTSMLRLETPG